MKPEQHNTQTHARSILGGLRQVRLCAALAWLDVSESPRQALAVVGTRYCCAFSSPSRLMRLLGNVSQACTLYAVVSMLCRVCCREVRDCDRDPPVLWTAGSTPLVLWLCFVCWGVQDVLRSGKWAKGRKVDQGCSKLVEQNGGPDRTIEWLQLFCDRKKFYIFFK